jgi:hypothetical protein
VAPRLLQWAETHPSSPFAAGARASAALKLSLERRLSLSLSSPLVSVSCLQVAEVIYCSAVSVETPEPTCLVMTPGFRLLRLLLLALPSETADYIAGMYL